MERHKRSCKIKFTYLMSNFSAIIIEKLLLYVWTFTICHNPYKKSDQMPSLPIKMDIGTEIYREALLHSSIKIPFMYVELFSIFKSKKSKRYNFPSCKDAHTLNAE